jgi:nucleoside-diphosphate-sugar epimerase
VKALVIGGTVPTGPYVVEGLLEKGYEVTLLHRGTHEVEFSRAVEHLHGDPHSIEALEYILRTRSFDIVLSMYGRLRSIAQVMRGRTSRFIGISGTPVYSGYVNPAHNPKGLLMPIPEDAPLMTDPALDKHYGLIALGEQEVMRAHHQGHYGATIFRYPAVYGPRQIMPREWSIVRRILDGRKHIIIPETGLTLTARVYAENAAHAVMLAVEHPQSGGRVYNVSDERVLSLKEWIGIISEVMEYDWEMVYMPWSAAKPVVTSYINNVRHRVLDITRIKTEIGYRDLVPTEEGIRRTVLWLLDHRPELRGEIEQRLNDSFDYEMEDRLIDQFKQQFYASNAGFRNV